MSNIKTFTGTIFLTGNVAVKSIADKTVLEDNPEDIAKKYDDFCVDSILIINLSRNTIEYQCSLETIERIIVSVDIPVIVAGCIRSKEDVDNLFEIGVSKVSLNFSKESNIAIAEEIKDTYNKESLLAAITSAHDIYDNRLLLEETVSSLIIMKDSIIDDCLRAQELDVYVPASDISLDKLITLFENDRIKSVFGRFVNLNLHDINSIKNVLKESGIETLSFNCQIKWSELTKNDAGLIPVIVQDYINNDVLMMAWMNQQAYENTIKTGIMNYYSRSRKSQWIKGETSGHFQYVKSLHADCDNDTLLAKVAQIGAACHTGNRSCFYKEIVKRKYIND